MIKIFDIVFYNGSYELLNFRFRELSSNVSYFIIITNYDTPLPTIPYNIKEKVFVIQIKDFNILHINNDELQSILIKCLLPLNVKYNDVILISNVNEIPDLDYYNTIYSKLHYGPVALNQIPFYWGINYYYPIHKVGTIATLFSTIAQKKIVFSDIHRIKRLSNIGYDVINSGWILNDFFIIDELLSQNRIPSIEINPITTYQLRKVSDDIKLPSNFELLPFFNRDRVYHKKHLFLVDTSYRNDYEHEYDTITIVKFNPDGISDQFSIVNDKLITCEILIPKNTLYGDKEYEYFIEDYKNNEIMKLMSLVFPMKNDIFIIKKNDGEDKFVF